MAFLKINVIQIFKIMMFLFCESDVHPLVDGTYIKLFSAYLMLIILKINKNYIFSWPIIMHCSLAGARCSSMVKVFTHGAMDPLSYFSFQPVLHDWCNKGCGICYPVCGMTHIKDPLLLIGKSSYLNRPLPYVRRHITVNKMC